jgi:hypothetical protein
MSAAAHAGCRVLGGFRIDALPFPSEPFGVTRGSPFDRLNRDFFIAKLMTVVTLAVGSTH